MLKGTMLTNIRLKWPMLQAVLLALVFGLGCVPAAQSQIDHRISQSPVKHQGARGTCVAFAINAAMEVFPGVPTDLSEQMSYATVKLHQNNVDRWLRGLGGDLTLSVGDNFATYARLTSILGTCAEAFMPYHPNPLYLPDEVPAEVRRFIELAQVEPEDFEQFRLAMATYRVPEQSMRLLSLGQARDVDFIKRELSSGRLAIPVTYQINAEAWSDLPQFAWRDEQGRRDLIHPGMMHRFQPPDGELLPYTAARLEAARRGLSFADAVLSGEWLVAQAFEEGYGGHAVTIVGYDELGFIIKNSWGKDWGDGGYARVTFDYHRFYASELLLIDEVSIQPPDPSPFIKTRSIREADWRLKITPGITGRDVSGQWQQAWMLSTWAHETRQPDAEVVEYLIEVQRSDGNWEMVLRTPVAAGPIESRNGLRLLVSDAVQHRIASALNVRVSVRYGDFPLGPADGLDSARFLVQHSFGPIPVTLNESRDFAPLAQAPSVGLPGKCS